MPAITVPKTPIAVGPGYLYRAPLGSGLPTNTVAASVFSVAWPGAYIALGVTTDGSEFGYDVTTEQIEAAEYFDPLAYVTTARVASIKFELEIISATFTAWSLNSNTVTVSGSGATQLNTVTPPNPGAEVRCMIGWESQDNTERLVFEQAYQVGTLAVSRKKGADRATLALEYRGEVAASGFPFQYFTAGSARG